MGKLALSLGVESSKASASSSRNKKRAGVQVPFSRKGELAGPIEKNGTLKEIGLRYPYLI